MIGLKKTIRNISCRITTVKTLLIVSVSISVSLLSCDESSIIGLNVQPTNDLLNVVFLDTSTLFTQTVKFNSLRTDAAQLQQVSNHTLLGYYWDPTFGKTSASFYTQLTLNTVNPDFGTNPIIDSVILSLVYDTVSYYGKSPKAPQNINVYEVLELMNNATTYYSNQTLTTSVKDLAGGIAITPNLTATHNLDGEILKPALRVRLDSAFGQLLLNSQNTANLLSNTAFQNFIKGLYITTENTASINSGEGNILKINFADSQTRLRLYYHSDTVKSKYDFSIGTSAALFSHFNHNFTDPDMISQINGTSGKQNGLVYVQSLSGVKVKIEMPYIMNLNTVGVDAINKSELVIKVDTSAMYQVGTFTPPAKLIVYGINDDGSDYSLPDTYEPANYSYGFYIGGSYNYSTHEYRINISRYIQQILSGKIKNNGLHLLAYQGAYNASRAVIGGGLANSPYQMKLNLTCTK